MPTDETPLLVVEDRFWIAKLGLVLAPFLPLSSASAEPIPLIGMKPDGTRFEVTARLLVAMPQPTPAEHFVNVVLANVTKEDVPNGTAFYRTR